MKRWIWGGVAVAALGALGAVVWSRANERERAGAAERSADDDATLRDVNAMYDASDDKARAHTLPANAPPPAPADDKPVDGIIEWTDAQGGVHYADSAADVPESVRRKARPAMAPELGHEAHRDLPPLPKPPPPAAPPPKPIAAPHTVEVPLPPLPTE